MDVVRQLRIDACVVAHERMAVSVVVTEKFGDMKPLRRSVCTPRPWRVGRAQRPDFGSFSRWLAFEAGVAKAFRNVMVSESTGLLVFSETAAGSSLESCVKPLSS